MSESELNPNPQRFSLSRDVNRRDEAAYASCREVLKDWIYPHLIAISCTQVETNLNQMHIKITGIEIGFGT